MTHQARRRIIKAEIEFVSLCPAGKNRLPVIYKADGTFELCGLVKADALAEQGTITALIYAPNHVDMDGDVADAEAIKGFCYAHARKGAKLDLRHDGRSLTTDEAFVAENFLVQKGDPRFADVVDDDGNKVDATGAWAQVIKIDSETLRADYRSGKWHGVSMFGRAQVEAIKAQSASDRLVDELAKRLLGTHNGGDDVEKAEVEQIVKAGNDGLVKTIGDAMVAALAPIVKALTPAPKDPASPEAAKPLEAPVFKGDRTNLEDLRKHAQATEEFVLGKDVDFASPVAVSEYVEKLSALRKARTDAAKAGGKGGKPARLPSAAATVAKAADGEDEIDDEDETDEAEIVKSAEAIAASANRRYGIVPAAPAKA